MNAARILAALLLLLPAGCDGIQRSRNAVAVGDAEAERLAGGIRQPAGARRMDTVELIDDLFAGDEVGRERHGEPLPPDLARSQQVLFDTGQGGLAMDEIAELLGVALSVPVRSDDGFGPARIRINHRGSAVGLLDKVAKSSDSDWEFRGATVRFQRMVTRSWTLYALAGSSDLRATVTGGGGAAAGSAGNGGASAAAEGAAAGTVQVSTAYAGELKPWADLKTALEALLDGKGSVTLSEATGRITARASPARIEQIDQLIQNENRRHGRQVVIHYAVYTISVRRADRFGFDPGLVLRDLGRKLYRFNLTGAPAGHDQAGGAGFSAAVLSTATEGVLGRIAGSQLVLDALSEYGAVSLVTSNDITALNNIPTPVNATQTISYLRQVATSQVAQVGASTSLAPGQVTVGFVMTLLPRILANGQLILRYGLTQTDLLRLRTITSNGVSIEAPETAQRAFQQQVRIRSGDTLVLASFRQAQATLAEQGTGSPQNMLLGGGKDGSDRHELSVIVMTPTVVPGVGMNAEASDTR